MLKIMGIECITVLGLLVLYEAVCIWDKLEMKKRLAAHRRHKPSCGEQMTKKMQEGLRD
ncbi:hypothetical protein [Pseudoramibacter alactolyticus]|uniref:hypothetical protein n=1 Tax=Pseudoramibacter alactolyticus TaxID=113287 RepID=UPI0023520774|nr:hypothetical protein [Pseudoramibacter alactolyticus]MBM6968666.1 hypothetical protein [Pseudoramibacter alactolyticus]